MENHNILNSITFHESLHLTFAIQINIHNVKLDRKILGPLLFSFCKVV